MGQENASNASGNLALEVAKKVYETSKGDVVFIIPSNPEKWKLIVHFLTSTENLPYTHKLN